MSNNLLMLTLFCLVLTERFPPADKAASGVQGGLGSKTTGRSKVQEAQFASTVCESLQVL